MNTTTRIRPVLNTVAVARTLAAARNESAPAEVEGSTRAALESASGDRHPLRATYDGPASLVNTRAVTYVHVGSGQAFTHLLRRSEIAPTRLGTDRELHDIKILAHDEDASPRDNAEYAKLSINCLVVTGTAKSVPLILARTLIEALQDLQLQHANLEEHVRATAGRHA